MKARVGCKPEYNIRVLAGVLPGSENFGDAHLSSAPQGQSILSEG